MTKRGLRSGSPSSSSSPFRCRNSKIKLKKFQISFT
jgi:hypothetical protein